MASRSSHKPKPERHEDYDPVVRRGIILDSLPQGVVAWDADFTLVRFNQSYVELNGYPEGFIRVGLHYGDAIRYLAERGDFGPIADMDAYVASRLREAGERRTWCKERVVPDGRILKIQRRPLPDGGFVSTFSDVTGIKRIEEEVERKSGLLAATLDVMNQGLVIYDAGQRLQIFNHAYVRMFRFPPGFITLGMSYEQVLSYLSQQGTYDPELTPAAVRERVESARRGKPHRRTHRLPDGTCIALSRASLPDGGFVITFADVTAEVKAAEDAQKMSAFLKLTQDNMAQGILVYDRDSRILNLNQRFLDLYNLPPDVAHIGALYANVIAFKARRGDYGAGEFADLIRGRIERLHDAQIRHLEHTSATGRTILMLRNPLADGSYVVTCTDVTEQRQAEREIQRQERMLRATFETISQGITVYDRDSRLVAYNTRYVEMYGFPPGFIKPGMSREEVLRHHAVHGGRVVTDIEAYVRDKMAQGKKPYLNERVRPNGTAILVRREPTPDGGFVNTFSDVTRRRAREERLKESEERYALAMKGANEGLWDWDVAHGEVYVSPRVRVIANLDSMPLRIPAGRWLTFVHPEDVPAYMAAIRAHFRGETEFFQCEYRVRGKDESYRWVLDRGLAMRGPDGRVHRMAGSIGDISLRKDAERRILEAKEAAELASRAKTEFLANVSHELRTPLNAIIGFSEVILKGLFGRIENDRYTEYLKDIHESGTHLLCLINDILDVAKAEVGKMELIEETINFPQTVASCVRLVQERARESRLAIRAVLPADLPWLTADLRKVRQIFLNLLSNAIKFTPEGGSITISAQTEAAGLTVTVTDTGIGIAPQDMEKALAPFGQVDSSLSRKHNGTGLGLPLCKALMEAHGGTLELESEVNGGTRVRLTFPPSRLQAAQVGTIATKV